MAITPTPTGPCDDWGLTWADVAARNCGSCAKIPTAAAKAQILSAAVSLIWEATDRAYGVCVETLRPCLSCSCVPCDGYCGCFVYQMIDLDPAIEMGERSRPVQSIEFVKVNGDTLVYGEDYILESNRWLLKLPRGDLWPACQDVALIPAPIEIRFGRGEPPPQDLLYSAVLPLARQMAAHDCGDPCSIDPSKVQAVQREGISFALISKGDAWKDGLTGDAGIDAAILRAVEALGGTRGQRSGMADPLELLAPRWGRPDFTNTP